MTKLCGASVSIIGSSRTDAGVHAWGQCASFSGDIKIPTENLQRALNDMLGAGKKATIPGDIFVKSVKEMPLDFHPRFDAKAKTYVYRIMTRPRADIFARNYYYQIQQPLNTDLMEEAATGLIGTHDFKSFQASGGEEKETTVRTISQLSIRDIRGGLAIHIRGDGFLYNMVRIITGTLVEVGLGKIQVKDLVEILEKKDRSFAGHTAPAQGLYLAKVHFDML